MVYLPQNLPNIKGEVYIKSRNASSPSGAFYIGTGDTDFGGSTDHSNGLVGFNAQQYDRTYGTYGSMVRPNSLTVFYLLQAY